jgi:hypothetical protein
MFERSLKLTFREQLKEQYNGKLDTKMKGLLYEIVAKIFRVLVNLKIIVPGGFNGFVINPSLFYCIILFLELLGRRRLRVLIRINMVSCTPWKRDSSTSTSLQCIFASKRSAMYTLLARMSRREPSISKFF